MRLKKLCKALTCFAAIACLSVTAWAADGVTPLETLEHDIPGTVEPADLADGTSTRASGSFGTTISANSMVSIGNSFSLDAGETVSFDCTYSPATASMDFGVIAPNGSFYYLNTTSGSIDKGIRVSTRGTYTLAVRNNSDSAVTVTGTVQY